MRVPNISLYGTSSYQLNSLTNKLRDANEVVSTQKRINNVSDDPIGLSQVLDLRLTIENLTQLDKNVEMGRTWINGTETALRSISDQIIGAKLLSIQMVNASNSASERADAVETVQGIIDQILSLGNAQVNGNYIFSGTKTNIRTFTYDDQTDPGAVIYNGNDSLFSIKTGQTTKLEVGRSGKEVLTENQITVDGTNNKIFFREDPGTGENSKIVLEGTIPDGTYTPETLAVVVRNAMNKASDDYGYEINYDVSYDADTQKFAIVNDGRYNGYMGFDLLWESGETPRIGGLNTQGVIKEGVNINVVNDAALIHDTPEPSGTAPLRLTWDGNSKWKVLNDPGYGLPLEISGTDGYIELDLSRNGISDINISLESPANNGGYIEFDIVSASDDHSIGPDLGFVSGDVSYQPPVSDSNVTLKTFDNTNNVIDFQENIGAGLSAQLSAAIPVGTYSDMDTLAGAIETSLENASVNTIDYKVTYSQVSKKFTIQDNGAVVTDLRLLWNSGTNTAIGAATELGYDNTADDTGATSYEGDNVVTLFTITTGSNDYINFKEILKGSSAENTSELTAQIPAGTYSSPESLARQIEDALEDVSELKGNRVDYEVSYSYISHRFTIKEDGELGRKLEDFQLLWGTGTNVSTSAASVLGFDEKDVASTPVKSEVVTWGLFETLFELKESLSKDDVDGISRAMTRLDTHYNSITSVLSDVGIKYNRLEIRKQVSAETKLTITERKSMIEDADIVESVMDLKSIQTAYEASLNSTAKIINMSLVDFL
ncbi:MAG: flagellar hook-associated protein FlgL [Proteobacteria bacterium]|nr:flagellar hook-associated protein FlgL [Pseudomonadota bacterium]MBU1581173.1 flagellar hook-associated protein FlgL [Pseudomonadota bacterium]MBU2454584.1 flagellar hook-associated protein FlgL [Pseudomonadota bacterium]MBU2628389.1 flagellar hook-associated protein FlgL [Pseudomonadota bacterium]